MQNEDPKVIVVSGELSSSTAMPTPSSLNTEESQKPPIIEEKYNTGFILLLVFTSCLGAFYFGYAMNNLNGLQQFFTNAVYAGQMDAILLGLVGALVSVGAMFGAITAGSLANKVGRRKAMYIADVIGIIGAVLSIVQNIPILIVGRIVSGFCVGLNSALVPMFVNEVSPTKLNGITGSMNQIFICFGCLTAYAMAYGIPYTNKDDPTIAENYDYNPLYWRVMLAFPAVIAIMRTLILRFGFNYDTPRYNVMVGKTEDAKLILERIYTKECAKAKLENLQIQQEIQNKQGRLKLKDMFTDAYRTRLLVACGLSILQQLSGINAIGTYSSKIFLGDGDMTVDKYNAARDLTVILGIVGLVVPLLCSLITSRVGRKTLLIIGTIICMVTLGVFAISYSFAESIAKICIFGYYVGFGMSLGPIVWMVIPEILPDVGIGIAVLANWFSAAIVVQIFPSLPFGAYNFLIFSGCCAVGLVFIIFTVKETRGKTPEQIAEMYAPKTMVAAATPAPVFEELAEVRRVERKPSAPPRLIIPAMGESLKREIAPSPGSGARLICDTTGNEANDSVTSPYLAHTPVMKKRSPLRGLKSPGSADDTRTGSDIESPIAAFDSQKEFRAKISKFANSKGVRSAGSETGSSSGLSRVTSEIIYETPVQSENFNEESMKELGQSPTFHLSRGVSKQGTILNDFKSVELA